MGGDAVMWDELEMTRVHGEFLSLAGTGEIWERVEHVAWQFVQRERVKNRQKNRDRRATPWGREAHCAYERTLRKRNKTIDAAVRCCRVCRRMYTQTMQQRKDGTRFCSMVCAAKHNYERRGRQIRVARRVTIDGKTRTVLEWAKLHGLKRETVYQRLRNGMAPEQAVTAPLIPQCERQHAKVVVIGGEARTMDEWAAQAGLTKSVVYRRVKAGMTLAEALTTGRKRGRSERDRLVTIGGETLNLSGWAKRYGITVAGICQRMRRGMSPVEAITSPKQNKGAA